MSREKSATLGLTSDRWRQYLTYLENQPGFRREIVETVLLFSPPPALVLLVVSSMVVIDDSSVTFIDLTPASRWVVSQKRSNTL